MLRRRVLHGHRISEAVEERAGVLGGDRDVDLRRLPFARDAPPAAGVDAPGGIDERQLRDAPIRAASAARVSSNVPRSWPRDTKESATMSSSGHVFLALPSGAATSLRTGCSSSGPGGTKRASRAITRPLGRLGAGPRHTAVPSTSRPVRRRRQSSPRALRDHLEVVQHAAEDVEAPGLEVDRR